MRRLALSVAYMPLVDAAPLIVAQEIGFAATEGLDLDLVRAPSWSTVRDMLSFGRVDAAHLLAPVPVAVALGLGGAATPLAAVATLSVNGNVVGVSRALAGRLRAAGHGFDFADAMAARAALAGMGPVRIGVPFPFSMHTELLHYWLDGSGADVTVQTIPPPLMAAALAAGEIDAFCVGEPWGSMAVETGAGDLLLPGSAIWGFAPEKVLAVRTDWAETEPHLLGRLMRAVWRAGRWLGDDGNRITAAEILGRAAYLDVPAEVIDRSLSGGLTISPRGDQRQVARLIAFHHGAATYPWRSHARWIAHRLAPRVGLATRPAMDAAATVFRTDLYRRHLGALGADLPGAAEKMEGTIRHPAPVASSSGRLFLLPDQFFDGRIFDPDAA